MKDIKGVLIALLVVVVGGCIYFLREQRRLIQILAESHLELESFMKADKIF